MKILLIHTEYSLKGGEDSVVEQEFSLLSENNKIEKLIFKNNNGIKGALQFGLSIWNIFIASKIKKKIKQFKPDIVHIHNWHFATGPIIFRTLKKNNLPIIVTLHNYRLLCPSAILLYKNQIYNKSLNSPFPWDAVRKEVYRNSLIQTFWLAFINWVHTKIKTFDKIDRYIVLTEFAKTILINSSLNIPAEKFIVKPNFSKRISIHNNSIKKTDFLFIGRIGEEKGIKCLIEAFKNNSYNINIGGDGPLKEYILEESKHNTNIRYRGPLNKTEVLSYMQQSELLIFPSIWYEGMPMTIIESFSVGTPVIASNIGAMKAMITDGYNGFLFETGNPVSLSEKIQTWHNLSLEKKEEMSQNAYNTYLEYYTPEINIQILTSIYQNIIDNK